MLPCLVWIPHTGADIYTRELLNLKADEILLEIRSFCDAFYDDNFLAIGEIVAIETEIGNMCRGLQFTAQQLERVSELLGESDALRRL